MLSLLLLSVADISAVTVVVVVVVVVTDAAVDAPVNGSCVSRGAKNDAAASFVKYLPEHFSLSFNGVLKCSFNLGSSIAANDFDFLLLF